MIDGSFEVERLEPEGEGHRLKLSFSGTFERTDTPGEERDSYQVAGKADLRL